MNTENEREIEKTQRIIRDYCNNSRFFKLPKTDELRKVDKLLEEAKLTYLKFKI